MPAETKPDRRILRFHCYNCIRNDAAKLMAGPHRTTGKWTLGQQFEHLAITMDMSIDGFGFGMPLHLRLAGKLLKNRFLTKGFPTGVKLGGRTAVMIPDTVSDEQGYEHLCRSIERCQNETKRAPSPLLGKLSSDEWEQLHVRHAELHLSFAQPLTAEDANDS